MVITRSTTTSNEQEVEQEEGEQFHDSCEEQNVDDFNKEINLEIMFYQQKTFQSEIFSKFDNIKEELLIHQKNESTQLIIRIEELSRKLDLKDKAINELRKECVNQSEEIVKLKEEITLMEIQFLRTNTMK